MSDKPHRRYQLDLQLGADTYEELLQALKNLHLTLTLYPAEEPDDGYWSAVSGGPYSGYNVVIRHDPEMDHDRYFKESDQYLDAIETRKASS